MKNIIMLILTIIAFASCEKIIEIDLNSSDPKIVIEGVVADTIGPYRIRITKTTDYFSPEDIPKISNAFVVISDDLGNSDTLVEIEPGIYETTNTQGQADVLYTISVTVDNEEYIASSTLYEHTLLDSLSFEEMPEFGGGPSGGGGGGKEDSEYHVICFFQDISGVSEFYRVIAYNNGERMKDMHLIDDKLSDGNTIEYGAIMGGINLGDTIDIELLRIDKSVYNYYMTLASLFDGSMKSSGTPANPNSNLSNGALGYFGAVAINRKTIIITEE